MSAESVRAFAVQQPAIYSWVAQLLLYRRNIKNWWRKNRRINLMRGGCLDCVRQRVAQAWVLAHDIDSVDEEFWFLLGSLQDVYSQLVKDHPEMARTILGWVGRLTDAANQDQDVRDEVVKQTLQSIRFYDFIRDVTEERDILNQN